MPTAEVNPRVEKRLILYEVFFFFYYCEDQLFIPPEYVNARFCLIYLKKKTILCTKILHRKYYVHHWRDIISAYIGKIKLFPWHPLLPWSQISKNTVVLIYRLLSVRSTSVPFPLASNWGAVCQIWSNSVLCDHEKQLKILFFWPTNGCNLCSVCVCAELGPVLNNSLLISPCHSTFRFCIHSLRCLQ